VDGASVMAAPGLRENWSPPPKMDGLFQLMGSISVPLVKSSTTNRDIEKLLWNLKKTSKFHIAG